MTRTEKQRAIAQARFQSALTSPPARHSYPLPASARHGAPADLHTAGGTASLYVHIPYCTARCTYCFFVTQIGHGTPDMRHYVSEIAQELRLLEPSLGGYRFTSLYYGGGTPGLLPAECFEELHGLIAPYLARGATVTVETHPHAADARRIAAWQAAGVDRVSLGVQTLDPGLLDLINRAPTGPHILPAIERLLAAGFSDVNADLLYGLPNQDLDSWQATLEAMVASGLPSLSIYRTSYVPFTRDAFRARGASFPDAATVQGMYHHAFHALNEAGFWQPRYGCSTFSRRPYPYGLNEHRQHILNGLPMVGIGMGAYGSVRGYTYMNHRTRADYVAALERGEAPVLAATPVDPAERPYKYATETWKLGFLSREAYADQFGEDVAERFEHELSLLQDLGEVVLVSDEYRMTERGARHPDAIADLFLSPNARNFLATAKGA